MTENIHIVFSRRPDRIPEDEYNRWYDAHLQEILVVPGFVSATRFKLAGEVVDPHNGTVYTHASLYELDDDPDAVMRALDEEVPNMDLPDWFDEIRFASWNCFALGGRVLHAA